MGYSVRVVEIGIELPTFNMDDLGGLAKQSVYVEKSEMTVISVKPPPSGPFNKKQIVFEN